MYDWSLRHNNHTKQGQRWGERSSFLLLSEGAWSLKRRKWYFYTLNYVYIWIPGFCFSCPMSLTYSASKPSLISRQSHVKARSWHCQSDQCCWLHLLPSVTFLGCHCGWITKGVSCLLPICEWVHNAHLPLVPFFPCTANKSLECLLQVRACAQETGLEKGSGNKWKERGAVVNAFLELFL
jgi:hypothetical protein